MRGMTLVELLITLSLMMLLGAHSLQGWQQQQQRLAVDTASMTLLIFLAHVQTVAKQRNQTLTIKQQRTAADQWCLWASEHAADRRCETKPLHRLLSNANVQLRNTPVFSPARFHGEHQTASGAHWQLHSGPYQIRVVLSSKGRLSRCSEQANLTRLRRCR